MTLTFKPDWHDLHSDKPNQHAKYRAQMSLVGNLLPNTQTHRHTDTIHRTDYIKTQFAKFRSHRRDRTELKLDAVWDGRLRPLWRHLANSTKLWPISCIIWKHDVIHKTGSTSPVAEESEEDWATDNMYQKIWKCDFWETRVHGGQTNRQTNKQTHKHACWSQYFVSLTGASEVMN